MLLECSDEQLIRMFETRFPKSQKNTLSIRSKWSHQPRFNRRNGGKPKHNNNRELTAHRLKLQSRSSSLSTPAIEKNRINTLRHAHNRRQLHQHLPQLPHQRLATFRSAILRPGDQVEVQICSEIWMAAGYEACQGEDEPFLGTEGGGGEVGFEGGEEGEEVGFCWGREGHFLEGDGGCEDY
jgi:hypothetical protein